MRRGLWLIGLGILLGVVAGACGASPTSTTAASATTATTAAAATTTAAPTTTAEVPVEVESLVRSVNEDLRPLLPRIPCPTLLIWGRNDTATPVSDGQEMQVTIPGAGLVVVESAGHYVFLDQEARVLAALESFLGHGEPVRG